MPAYHSKLVADRHVANMAVLPFRTKFRGPIQWPHQQIPAATAAAANGDTNGHTVAPVQPPTQPPMDIIDEALLYFKPNVFFKTFEIQSAADRVLIYLTLYITECLKRLQRLQSRDQGLAEMYALAISRFDIPGDPGFPLNAVYAKPSSAEEQDLMRQYLLQLRQECGLRVADKVWDCGGDSGRPSKWWLCFAKKRFMDISLAGAGK
ncbi:actin-related protein 2/3 complex subunit 3-like [Oppia nitens]|uniref:actin-related protein 2/3 complex subunit 3-like n=1 Tax=Oppia nitens TaxID=1686743 RepID=UPI0023DAF648|nr:actin-related protein 2/3 complex subunit 3-like [Oppia nitens]XP_054158691.1 actin-related protein 2/3 complex subunit 3-like [Oppia nitens]